MQQTLPNLAPVEIPFSGTTDSTGKYVFTGTIRAAFWCVVKCTGISQGNPSWLLEAGGAASGVGLGPVSEIGPIIVGPQEQVVLTVTGATPSTLIKGAFTGLQGDTLQEVTAHYFPQPNTLAISQSAQQVVLDNIHITSISQQITHNGIRVPPGTHSLAITNSLPTTVIGNLAFAQASGEFSRSLYIAGTDLSTYPLYGTILPTLDPTVTWTAASTAASAGVLPFDVWLVAILDPLATSTLITNSVGNGNLLQVAMMDTYNTKLLGFADRFGDFAHNLGVTSESAFPAPWQSPTDTVTLNGVLGAGGTTVLLAGSGGTYYFIHQVSLVFSAAPPNPVNFEDTSGVVHRQVAPGAGVTQGPFIWDLKGMRLPLGRGFQFHNASGSAVGAMASVDYAAASG